jgi:hypothetical protein
VNAARVLEENEQFASAIRVLNAAKPLAKTLEETDSILRRIDSIERRQAEAELIEKRRNERAAAEPVAKVEVAEPAREEEPALPAGAPGARHIVSGVLRGVKCSDPAVLRVTLDQAGKPISLYANNYYKIVFTTAGYTTSEELHPCKDIEGMKARVVYGEVTDARVSGQIVSIQLSK